MRPELGSLLTAFAAIVSLIETPLHADAPEQEQAIKAQHELTPAESQPIKAFTGKIARNKVRLRLQPNLDSTILREFNRGDMIIVVADAGEFYAVKPPEDFKGYIFRTFVLDNVVEGNRVNIRLEPDTESPVIGQINQGAHVNGQISPLNSKWLEIVLPNDLLFYVSKEYVENIGDSSMFSTIRQRREEVTALLTQAQGAAQDELQKPFEKINLDPVYIRLNKVINQFSDFPDQVSKAKDFSKQIQEAYLQKKIAYLETRAKALNHNEEASPAQDGSTEPSHEIQTVHSAIIGEPGVTPKMAAWVPLEAQLYAAWSKQHDNASNDEFYAQQRQEAVILTGTIEPYVRSLRNKPGDYILVSKSNQHPSAYLYSTKVDLQSKLGQEVTLIATPRPNNSFAFPAYFVLAVE